jgi:Family of unknown function (DUF5989)
VGLNGFRRRAEKRVAEEIEMNRATFSLLGEFWGFLRVRKKWWLAPIIFMMVLLGVLIFFTQGSAVAPFIYTLF